MNIRQLFWAAFAVMVSVFAYSVPANAQATRTFVSGVGDDVNPCSRTAPCKTFAGAISKTAAGGEISVLDPGGFGALTITKSISIIAEGSEGSILSAASNGITINAGAADVVHIHGIYIEGAVSGLNGIRILSAKSVYISKTTLRGHRAEVPNGCGVNVLSQTNPVRVYLRDVELNNNRFGLCIDGSGAALNSVFVERSTMEGNLVNTMKLDGANASVALFDSVLTGTSVSLSGGATFGSAGNNRIAGAVGPTVSLPLQ